ncbi:hypothetical protein [Nocardia pneumoniae]|uniref:hypothetical protein n=1 Tax=Nocardia pneumoniae TaxID=228601 RepID=UPI00030C7C5B|nr:hypothetical protein [Nocardia pneumoniae]
MFALRGIFVGALIGAATLVGGGAATAEPLPLETFTPAPTESVAGGWCDANPVLGLWCLIASQSA